MTTQNGQKIEAAYVDHMGDDLDVANSARVSFDKHSDTLVAADCKLIRYLSTHDHFTPFTHQVIKMRETVPISMARQRFKHTVGFTYNEVSRRYVSDTPDYFHPEVFHAAPEASIKQGSGEEHPASKDLVYEYGCFIQQAIDLYLDMINEGIAPEEARLVLPQGVMTSYIVTGSLAAWARAYSLRHDPQAQKMFWPTMTEQWDSIIRPLFPVSWSALVDEK